MNSIIVHYQEIALKGRNRPYFIAKLVRNLRRQTADIGVQDVRALMGRIEIVLGPLAEYQRVEERLHHVFGIANFSKAGRVALDFEVLCQAILADLEGHPPVTFRVNAKRGDKRFPMTSPEVEREIGGRIVEALGWKVKLDRPELSVNVELLSSQAFYSWGKQKGAGGMPTGVSGRVACLLSGGIDSPVAAWRLMKRGCTVVPIHFHSYPFVTRASQEKVREIVEILTRYQMKTTLKLVPFGELQRQIVLSVPPPLRVVIYRRMMLRIAERLARDTRARALVTGEVIGQVASQTLENLTVIAAATQMPILRPLVGMDKEEIIVEAQRIGTYEISIVPDQDCCQLFTPRSPETHARGWQVDAVEARLPVQDMVASAIEATVTESFEFPERLPGAEPDPLR
ncbi:MAG: tRNA 4-thiouridine(8) synthase ThiI [Acidobacteria bacterium]|nr:tRNA 4-thiouridine(8) synthase ThiI [Acidobacteriota bacterium]